MGNQSAAGSCICTPVHAAGVAAVLARTTHLSACPTTRSVCRAHTLRYCQHAREPPYTTVGLPAWSHRAAPLGTTERGRGSLGSCPCTGAVFDVALLAPRLRVRIGADQRRARRGASSTRRSIAAVADAVRQWRTATRRMRGRGSGTGCRTRRRRRAPCVGCRSTSFVASTTAGEVLRWRVRALAQGALPRSRVAVPHSTRCRPATRRTSLSQLLWQDLLQQLLLAGNGRPHVWRRWHCARVR